MSLPPFQSPWEKCAQTFLDSYLVQETENPCINPQSVLIRGLLADSLFPEEFDSLINDELQYSAAAMVALSCMRQGWFSNFKEILLNNKAPNDGEVIPEFFFDNLSFSVSELLTAVEQATLSSFDNFESPFFIKWKTVLQHRRANPLRVLELACGSANDYRYFSRYGLDAFLDYMGVDFTPKNIENARKHCPEAAFQLADICSLPFEDKSFDYTYGCDIMEHLAEESLEKALSEAIRVTRKELWLSFFNLDWIAEHEFLCLNGRYSNKLSHDALMEFFRKNNCESYLIDIPNEWPKRFPGYIHYNDRARFLVVKP